ncbi:MAG TPA: CHASE2 domain-containing protein [Candidatus Angelobacter sp.]|jgi:CHASE2 domain-containing sensor protein
MKRKKAVVPATGVKTTTKPKIWRTHPQRYTHIVGHWRFLSVLVLLLFFTNWLGHRWVFERGSLAGTDILLGVTKPRPAKHCRLITIDEQEFDKYLGEWLQPDNLSAVLKTILAYQPKVLAIDIDTSAPRFRKLQLPATQSKIVWARVSHQDLVEKPGQRRRSYIWKAGGVLGNRADQPEYVGSPLFPQDPDGTVRGYQRRIQIDAKTQSLHWAILNAYCATGAQMACSVIQAGKNGGPTDDEEADRTKPALVDWDFVSSPLSDLMSQGGSAKSRAGELGDVVILGAKFNDVHATPFGPKLGIELTSSAVEAELAEMKDPWEIHGWSTWALKIALALVIVWLNSRLLPIWAATGTLTLLVLVFLASFLGIYYGLFRMDFLPFVIGIWIEQLIEGLEKSQDRMHDLGGSL